MKTINSVAIACSVFNITVGICQNDLGKALFGLFLFLVNLVMRRWCE